MRRRGAGVGAINKSKLAQARYRDKGYELAADELEQMSQQLEAFRNNLEEFATKYKNDIRKNSQFRQQFQEMCASIGVDPLASNKGFWSEALGVGDFYYELAVQIVEVCLASRHRDGGLMKMDELQRRLVISRGKSRQAQDLSLDDVLRAVRKLKILGSGFAIIPVGAGYLVQSIPGELNMDHTLVLQEAQETGYVTESLLQQKLRWEKERAKRAVEHMVKEGLIWVDDQAAGERYYWFPGLFSETTY